MRGNSTVVIKLNSTLVEINAVSLFLFCLLKELEAFPGQTLRRWPSSTCGAKTSCNRN